MIDDDKTTQTTFKTLWSETVLEVLYLALKYEKPDRDILEILNFIRMKGRKPEYIIRKVYQKLGEEQAMRVKILLGMGNLPDIDEE